MITVFRYGFNQLLMVAVSAPVVFSVLTCASSSLLSAAAQVGSVSPLDASLPTPAPHAVVMRSDKGDTRILHREGWTRGQSLGGGLTSIYMTGSGGHNYRVILDADGAPLSMQLDRAQAAAGKATRTGASDTVLGEQCEIWSSTPALTDHHGYRDLSCIATDGIVLWNGYQVQFAREPTIGSRAISIERRTPGWEEFSFPGEALDWSYWSSRLALNDAAQPEYEIRYEDRVIRVRGDKRFESRPNGVWALGSNFRLSYSGLDGLHPHISISTSPERPYPHPLSGGSETMDRPPLHISGERCDWHRVDLSVRWGIVGVCVTNDGIKFAESTEYDDEKHQDKLQVATYFRRGAVDNSLMAPSENVFEPWIAALPH